MSVKKNRSQVDKSSKDVKTLGGVDSLYYFIDDDDEVYHKFYKNIYENPNLYDSENIGFMCHTNSDNGVIGLKYKLFYNGTPLCFATFKDPTKQKKIKNIYIQLLGDSIYSLGLETTIKAVASFLKSFIGLEVTYKDMYPSRVDVNCFVGGFDFSKITKDCFSGHFYNSRNVNSYYIFENRSRLETLYLGSRSSKISFKMYDKRLELTSSPKMSNLIKTEYLKQNGFDINDELWNLEFCIKREYLKECGLYTIESLLIAFNMLYNNAFYTISFLGFDTDKIKRAKKSRNLSKLEVHPVWKKIQDTKEFHNDINAMRWSDTPIHRVVENANVASESWHRNEIIRLFSKFDTNGWNKDTLLAVLNG